MQSNLLLTVYQGESLYPPPISYVDKNWNPISLTGCSATLSVKCDFNSDIFIVQATTQNGQLIITGDYDNEIQINVPYEQLAPFAPFEGVWDLFIYYPSNIAVRLLGGRFLIPESVTG